MDSLAGRSDEPAPGQQHQQQQTGNCCSLTSLQLVAVQPACLRAHPDTPIPQQQQQDQPPLAQAAAELQHHELLLQLHATLTQRSQQPVPRHQQQQGPHLQVSTVSGGANLDNSPLLPLPVQKGVLQVVLLNRHMQVLLHKQYSFQQLLQKQQQQQQLGASSSACSSSSALTAAAAAGSSSQGVSSCMSSHEQDTDDVLLHLNIQLSAPSQPSPHPLDALHLFVTLCSSQLSDPAQDFEGQQQACLVAELPLLVMPAAAQQEVQQRLLPAMRQDVQDEQLQLPEAEWDAAAIAAQSLQLEQAVWQHFNQLALDILLIMQLSEAVRAEAAQGAAGTDSSVAPDSSAPLSPSAAGSLHAAADETHQHSPQLLQAQLSQWQLMGPEAHGMALASGSSGTRTALDNLVQAVDTLLLPLLLPFLTAHGLHNTLQALLQCLPPQLQLQQHWQQQQLARLQALTVAQAQHQQPQQEGAADMLPQAPAAAAAAVVVSSAVLDTQAAPPAQAESMPAPAAADDAVSAQSSSVSCGSLQATPEARQVQKSPDQSQLQDCASSYSSCDSKGSIGQAQSSSRSRSERASSPAAAWGDAAGSSQQQLGFGTVTPVGSSAGGIRRRAAAAGRVAGRSPSGDEPGVLGEANTGSSNSNSSSSTIRRTQQGYQFGVLTQATGMPCWLVPLKQFEGDMERRYVAYKHHQLLFLDIMGGVYQLGIAAALTKRALWQHPATWVLLLMTLIKALPHVPLLLSYKQQHIRFRELWMFLASPAIGLLLSFLVLFTNAWQPAAMPPMPVAYRSFWRMHGELLTASLRAFFQHQRLTPFILYTLVDRVISMQLWAPWSGVLNAVRRSALAGAVSVVACWALELCYRRRFVLDGLYAPAGPVGGVGAAWSVAEHRATPDL